MYKRLLKKIRYLRFLNSYPDLRLGSLLVALICTFLIIVSTFSQLKMGILTLPEDALLKPVEFFSNIVSIKSFTRDYYYIPQIPAILFAGALLGPRIGVIAVAIYILAGLAGLPVFASGGGITYYSQSGFGYIIGYLAGAFVVGNILSAKITNFSLIRAAIVGVLAIHIVGILYLVALMLLQHESIFSIFGWIWALSGMPLIYDILVSFAAIAFARPVRGLLWVAMD